MIRRPPRSTRTDTLFPYTTLFRFQLVRAADDRRARHGIPADEQHLLLAADPRLHAAAQLALLRWRGQRLDTLCAAFHLWRAGAVNRYGHPVDAPCRRLVDPRRDHLHHHDLQHARAGHDAAQDAAVRLRSEEHTSEPQSL